METKENADNIYKMINASGTVAKRCSVKKVFLEIHKIHRKTPVPESLFYKIDSSTGVSLWILWNFLEYLHWYNTSGGCFWCLAMTMQKCLYHYEKGNKLYKERYREKNAWRTVKQFLIVFSWTIRDQSILWKAVHFSSLLPLKHFLYKLRDMWFSIIDTYLLP